MGVIVCSSGLQWYLIIFDLHTLVLDWWRYTWKMPSHKFVPERSKNFTSHAQIRFPPTTPINPVFGKVPKFRERNNGVIYQHIIQIDRKNRQKTDQLVDALSFHALSYNRKRLPWTRCFLHSDNDGRSSMHPCVSTGVFPQRRWNISEEAPRPDSVPIYDRVSKKGTGMEPKLENSEFNYEPFNSSSVNIRYWSWNYRGCWHQTCPPIVTRWWF